MGMEDDKVIKNDNILFLFDVDGTLTLSRKKITPKMLNMLKELKKRVKIGFVGGSDLCKQIEQVGDDLLNIFDYGFPENGVQYYKNGELISSESIVQFLGEETYQLMINRILRILSETILPVKRGLFIEMRQSMVNVSPIGRNCSQEERNKFFEYDNKHHVRQKICNILNNEFEKYKLYCSIGGQISIDIFPKGWDKTYALNHIKEQKIFFFGDMTQPGGNDYEIYKHISVNGNSVKDPDDTFIKVNEVLKKLNLDIIN